MIPALVTAVELPEAELGEPVDVVGPLCTPLDCWARDVRMAPVVPGDLLAVPNVGAYGLTASLIAFLSRPTPVEAVVDGERLISSGRIELVRVEEVARE
jgi:diaminopimelate decarboxylase